MYSEGQLRFKKLLEALGVCVLHSLECESWCSLSKLVFFFSHPDYTLRSHM